MSVPDEVMGTYYSLLLGEDARPGRPPDGGEARARPADREWFWDAEAARAAEAHFDQVHVEGGTPDEMPEVALDGGEIHLPALIADAFEVSRSEARRIVAQGGVKLDGEAIDPDRLDLPAAELDGQVLQVGKRRFARLRAAA